MVLEMFQPGERLAPFVKHYVIVECPETVINNMLPDTSLVMGFRYRGMTRYVHQTEDALPFAVLAGLRKSIQLMKDEAGTANLLVVLKPMGAAVFFKEPIHTTFGEVLPLDVFSGYKALSDIEDQLGSARSNDERVRRVEAFLLSKLRGDSCDCLVYRAIQLITTHSGILRINELAHTLAISVDAFEKRFRRATGATPKQFSHLVRMNATIGSLAHKSLAQVALAAGYYDQAHFSRDFKIHTGQTPSEFRKKLAAPFNDFLQD